MMMMVWCYEAGGDLKGVQMEIQWRVSETSFGNAAKQIYINSLMSISYYLLILIPGPREYFARIATCKDLLRCPC